MPEPDISLIAPILETPRFLSNISGQTDMVLRAFEAGWNHAVENPETAAMSLEFFKAGPVAIALTLHTYCSDPVDHSILSMALISDYVETLAVANFASAETELENLKNSFGLHVATYITEFQRLFTFDDNLDDTPGLFANLTPGMKRITTAHMASALRQFLETRPGEQDIRFPSESNMYENAEILKAVMPKHDFALMRLALDSYNGVAERIGMGQKLISRPGGKFVLQYSPARNMPHPHQPAPGA